MIDNFYLRDKNPFTIATIAVAPHQLAPIQHLTYSSYQYYLPDEYRFFILSNLIAGEILVLPLGKNHEIQGPSLWGAGFSYPSKDITFHLRSLYGHANDNVVELSGAVIPEAKEYYDFYIKPLPYKLLRPKPFIRKLLDVYGVDYVTFPLTYLDKQMKAEEKAQVLQDLRSQGYTEFKFPESYRTFPKFPKIRQMRVFTNPQSYGRAYVARWVKVG